MVVFYPWVSLFEISLDAIYASVVVAFLPVFVSQSSTFQEHVVGEQVPVLPVSLLASVNGLAIPMASFPADTSAFDHQAVER